MRHPGHCAFDNVSKTQIATLELDSINTEQAERVDEFHIQQTDHAIELIDGQGQSRIALKAKLVGRIDHFDGVGIDVLLGQVQLLWLKGVSFEMIRRTYQAGAENSQHAVYLHSAIGFVIEKLPYLGHLVGDDVSNRVPLLHMIYLVAQLVWGKTSTMHSRSLSLSVFILGTRIRQISLNWIEKIHFVTG